MTEEKKTKKGASADCIFHMQKRKISTLKPVCLNMHREEEKKPNLQDSTDKDKSEERLCCCCSAADISAGIQMRN